MKAKKLFLLFCIMYLVNVTLFSADYFHWKGPDQNGIVNESSWFPDALKRPTIKWKKNIGIGYSNVSIKDGFIYTQGYDKNKEKNIIYCLDEQTGDEKWRYSYRATIDRHEGSKPTPIIDDNRVYTMGQDGDVLCNDITKGKLLWKKHLIKDFGSEIPRWNYSASARIEGSLILINALEHGIALDKMTGEAVWKSGSGKGNYATPVSFDFEGNRLAVFCSQENIYAADVKTGKVQWEIPWITKRKIIAADPYIYGTYLFISTGYGEGCALYDFSSGKPVEKWRNKNLSTHFDTAVIIDGYIYGIDGNAGTDAELKCLDIKDGSVKWSKELGFASVVSANGYLIVLTEYSEIYVCRVDPNEYMETVKYKKLYLNGPCWTAPVLSNSTLYVRSNKGDLVSIDLSKVNKKRSR